MITRIPVELKKKDTESNHDFFIRVCALKNDYNLTWDQIADICNEELLCYHGESYYRKAYKKYLLDEYDNIADSDKDSIVRPSYSNISQATINSVAGCKTSAKDFNEIEDDVDSQERLLEKYEETLAKIQSERYRLADERNYNNQILRRLSREDTIKDIAIETANILANSKPLLKPVMVSSGNTGDKKGILCISDWHYGMVTNTVWNQYNPEIAARRISQLCDETIRLCKEEDIHQLYVANLGDLIAGRIHAQIRIQSRYDVVTQEMYVSELLAEFLTNLSAEPSIEYIEYHDCLDNHSRLEPNKKESLNLESLARFTSWYLKPRLKDNEKICICDVNSISEDILDFKCGKHIVGGVHGDQDKPNRVVDGVSMYTKEQFDMLLTAHLHHFSGDEKNNTLVVSNGSLMGCDDFSESLRLNSVPSQNFIVSTDDNVAKKICRIILK